MKKKYDCDFCKFEKTCNCKDIFQDNFDKYQVECSEFQFSFNNKYQKAAIKLAEEGYIEALEYAEIDEIAEIIKMVMENE